MKVLTRQATQKIVTSLCSCVLFCASCTKVPSTPGASAAPATKSEVVHFCGDCHAYPQPETFPIQKWREEVVQGYEFYQLSNRSDLAVPDAEAVIAYYESLAPEYLKIPLPNDAPPTSPIVFSEEKLNRVDAQLPAISNLSLFNENSSIKNSLVVTDMREGQVSLLTFDAGKLGVETMAEIPFPAHIDRCDLNSDGIEDWLVSDLGSFEPADHKNGQLVWFNIDQKGFLIDRKVILSEVGRIADARADDFDHDGDQDIVVAVFGWRKEGKLIWLEQIESNSKEIKFKEHLISDRHGCSHVPLVDLNQDGHLDIVALFSQEFETIEAYYGDGKKSFTKSILYQSDDPSYGSSSIELSDFDSDGDMDVLYTNGDSFDSHLIKPYHSVQWLEQTAGQHFVHHHITDLPGAYCVQAGDIDGDGDQDLVACSMTLNFDHPFHTLIWLERQDNGQFLRHNLETGIHQHACLQLGDFDMDNDLDVAVGHFEPRPVQEATWLTIWWNEGRIESNAVEKTSVPHSDSKDPSHVEILLK